jgi:hypothetical protein
MDRCCRVASTPSCARIYATFRVIHVIVNTVHVTGQCLGRVLNAEFRAFNKLDKRVRDIFYSILISCFRSSNKSHDLDHFYSMEFG